MVVVKAAKVDNKKTSKRELYATLCYHYPQYKLHEVPKLKARDINLLIRTAQKIEALKMHNFTQIAYAPHSHKAHGVKKLLDHFKKIARM